jgi:long-chain fatty acid transport protein
MRHLKQFFLLGIAGVQLFAAGTAAASGFGLNEHSARAMGAAYAGASATGSDASYLFYNPATLSMVENIDFSASGVGILPGSSASYSLATTSVGNPNGGSASPSNYVENAFVPALGARVRLTPELSWGVTVNAPWGLNTSYDPTWAGRYYGRTTKLLTVNIMSALAYEVTPQIALAAGVQAQYAKGRLTSVIDLGTLGLVSMIPGSLPGMQDGTADYRGNDWGFGFTLGVLANLSEDLSVGLSYSSEIRHEFEGPLTFTLDSDGIGATINFFTGALADTRATAKITTPARVNFGARLGVSERWTALFEIDWTNWNSFNELRVNAINPAQPADITTANWEDSWLAALGFEYAATEDWMLRFGVAYDASPTPSNFREVRVPDNDRLWASVGTTYKAGENSEIILAYGHMFIAESDISLNAGSPENALRGNLTGKPNVEADVIGVQFVHRIP